MKFYRAVLVGICLVSTVAFLVLYFTQNATRGRARIDPSRLALEFNGPQKVELGSTFDLRLRIISPTNKVISAATVALEYDSDYLELVGYGTDTACAVLLDRVLPVTLPETEEFVLTKVKDIDSAGVGTPFCFEHLRFRAKAGGTGTVRVKTDDGRTAAVGLSAATDRFTMILDDIVSYNVSIQSGNGVDPTNTPQPSNVTNTPAPGSGGVGTPTPTPVSFVNVTPRPGQVGIKLRIKFQGITTLLGQGIDRQRVGVAVGGGRLRESTEYHYDEFIAIAPGIFEGVVIFPQDILKPGTGYKILIKGPKHLAKRFCAPDANDAKFGGDGKYFCSSSAGAIELREGINTFDFTKVYLPAGDLKVDGVQDGVVDAVDLAFLRKNLSKVEQGVVKIGDINLDMIVDSQDYSLVLSNIINNEDEN